MFGNYLLNNPTSLSQDQTSNDYFEISALIYEEWSLKHLAWYTTGASIDPPWRPKDSVSRIPEVRSGAVNHDGEFGCSDAFSESAPEIRVECYANIGRRNTKRNETCVADISDRRV